MFIRSLPARNLHCARQFRCARPTHLSHTVRLGSHRERFSFSENPNCIRIHQPSRSSAPAVILAVLAAGFIVSGFVALYSRPGERDADFIVASDQAIEAEENRGMVMLPGRPGNLSADQEVKLQELWLAIFKIMGVKADDEGLPVDSESQADSHEAGEGEKEKKKKKRGLFGRKNASKEDEPPNGASSHDPSDKYNEMQGFQDMLHSTTPEELRKVFWRLAQADNPDALLLRFLRARKWDVEKALFMLVSTMHWRLQEMHVTEINKTGEAGAVADSTSADPVVRKNGEDFMTQLRLGKSFLHGIDNDGRPICTVRVRLHRQGEQSEASLERFTVFTIEVGRLIVRPPADTVTIIFDMTGFSRANMDYGPVKFMIKCFEANYPESLGVVLVHKAPWIFQGIWKIIRGWLDPVVAGKVHFTNDVEELAQYIPRENLIHELGGDDPWAYHYIEPLPNENAVMADTAAYEVLLEKRNSMVREFEVATLDWIHTPVGQDEEIKKRRDTLTAQFHTSYWALDPYLRARSLYDRSGVISPDGTVDFRRSTTAPINSATKEKAAEPLAAHTDMPVSAGHDANDVD